jgi:hypothetical protein
MFARGVSSFYPPRLHASSGFPSKPFVSPTCKITVRNSFVSPTYAKTGGCTPPKMSARRHFLSLFSQSPLSALLLFIRLRTLSFSVSSLSPALPISSALLPPKQGVHPLWPYQSPGFAMTSDHSSSPSTVDCQLLAAPSPPFTAHSQTCYPTFTHLCLSLVTINPSQGPTHTPCLSLSHRVRYTSTNAIRSARCLHETRTHH